MFSLHQGDAYGVAQAIRRLSVQVRPMNDLDYVTAVERILNQEWKYGVGSSFGAMMNKVMAELKHHFRPEFLNRVDDVILFQSLDG